jgi:hypothetical protein
MECMLRTHKALGSMSSHEIKKQNKTKQKNSWKQSSDAVISLY